MRAYSLSAQGKPGKPGAMQGQEAMSSDTAHSADLKLEKSACGCAASRDKQEQMELQQLQEARDLVGKGVIGILSSFTAVALLTVVLESFTGIKIAFLPEPSNLLAILLVSVPIIFDAI